MDKKSVEPTPDNFESYEAAADFWDTHDTTDYLDEFRTVEGKSNIEEEPKNTEGSPLDVEGVDLRISTAEVIDFIREGRKQF